MLRSAFAAFRQDLSPRRLAPLLTVALISALVVTTYQVSYGTLIFSGELSAYLSNGIGFCLMGVVALATAEALLSSAPGMVAIPTVNSAVIIAAMATGISAQLGGDAPNLFPTVTAAISLASLLTGGAFLALGAFHMGNLIRYIPYPVIGGFLAGTGWLVVTGAARTMTDLPFNLANLPAYLYPDLLQRWLPGALFGLILLLVTRRYKHYLLPPLMILGGVALFYAVLLVSGIPVSQASQMGLLFAPFPPGALWQPPPLADLAIVDWGAIARQGGEIASLVLISSITLLLYATGVEVSADKEINLNQELRSCGVGNLAAALTASPPGYTIITMSVLSHKLGAHSRLVGLFIALLCALVMFFAGPLIALFPRPVLGGVLVYLGMTFLADWLVAGFRRLSHPDYAIVVAILLAMSSFGLLTGLAVGITLAAGLFILEYSRVPVVRSLFSGRHVRSRVERTAAQHALLEREGGDLLIMELQGYIFFGTANSIYQRLRARLRQPESTTPRLIVLDFRRVSGVDASAASSFARLKRLLRQQDARLLLTHLSPQVERQLRAQLASPQDGDWISVLPDLDHALEDFEEAVLQGEIGQQVQIQASPGAVQPGQDSAGLALLFAALGEEAVGEQADSDQALLSLLAALEREQLTAGQVLLKPGDTPRKLYFLDSGVLTQEYHTADGRTVRLESAGPGAVVGELGLYLEAPHAMTVTAAQDSVVHSLSAESLARLEREHPAAAAALHRFLVKRLGSRLQNALLAVEELSA